MAGHPLTRDCGVPWARRQDGWHILVHLGLGSAFSPRAAPLALGPGCPASAVGGHGSLGGLWRTFPTALWAPPGGPPSLTCRLSGCEQWLSLPLCLTPWGSHQSTKDDAFSSRGRGGPHTRVWALGVWGSPISEDADVLRELWKAPGRNNGGRAPRHLPTPTGALGCRGFVPCVTLPSGEWPRDA